MSLSHSPWRGRTLLVVLMFGLSAGLGWIYAQRDQDMVPPESLIPMESVIYCQFDGAMLHDGAYRQTAAYQALNESGLMDAIENVLKSLAEQNPDAREALEAMKHLQDHGLSLGIAVEPPQQGPPRAWGVIVVHDAAEGVEFLEDLVRRAKPPEDALGEMKLRGRTIRTVQVPNAPVELGWWAEQGHLLIAVGMNAFESALEVADGNRDDVTHNPLWRKYGADGFDFAVNSSAWFHFGALREMFGEMPVPVPARGRNEAVTVNNLLATVGLDRLNSIACVTGYKGKSCWSEVFVDAEEGREGLLGLIDQPSMALEDLPPIPAGQTGILINSFDWPKFYDTVEQLIGNVSEFAPPDFEDQIQEGMRRFENGVGISVEEVFAPLGHINCLYTDTNQGMFGLGSIAVMSLKDADQAQNNLNAILETVKRESRGEVETRVMEMHGATLTIVEIPKFPVFNPTIAITDDWMIVGLVSQAVQAELLRIEGSLPSYDLAGLHADAWDELPKEFTSLTIIDPRDTYAAFLGFAPSMVGFIEMGLKEEGAVPRDFELPFNPADIPPVELVTAPLFVNIAMNTVDENGLHTYSRSSLPGIPIIGGGDGGTAIATTGVLVALLLPAVQSARTAARDAQSKINLKQIALALHNYHDVYESFPPGTIENANLPVDERLSWMVPILPFIDQQSLWTLINMKEAWNSDANFDALTEDIPSFLNPNSPEKTYEGYPVTGYVGIGGVGEDAPELPANHRRAGIFGYNRVTRIRDITDGTSNTMMTSEASDHGPWSAGGYSTIRAFTEVPYINGPDNIGNPWSPRGTNVGMADGSVRTVNEDIDPSVIEAMATINGGERVDFDF
ncbi:MAG: DUF1559 domain-containing protein [Planctomycetaceae bacterium]|nr:DUF1559 domain-containing protein [Planctomycetaceae bacterium]